MISPPLRFLVWAPDPVMFTIGDRPLTWYAFLFVCGLLGAYALAAATFIRERIDITYANILLAFVAVGAVVGARLGEVLFYEWRYYSAHPAEIARIWRGGLASHGAVMGIALMLWLFARVVIKQPFLWVLDRSVPGIALAAAFVRFGNLLNSEILGKPTSVAWAFVFQRVDSIPRHPVQLYEGIAYLLLCVGLFVLGRRYALPEGCLSGLFLVGMFVPRWLLEFTKDGRGLATGMNTGQVLSLPLVVLGVWMLVACRAKGSTPRRGAPRGGRAR
jgi:phosphatidylglycerol---prolipoprotein diacylglyceryl transferase